MPYNFLTSPRKTSNHQVIFPALISPHKLTRRDVFGDIFAFQICFHQFGQSFVSRLFFYCYQTLSFHKPLRKNCPSLRLYHALDLVHVLSDSAQDLDTTSTCIWVFPPMSCCFAKTRFPFLLMSPSCVIYSYIIVCILYSHFKPSRRSLHVTNFISLLHWGHSSDFASKPSTISHSIKTSLSIIQRTKSSYRHCLCSLLHI